MKIPIAVDRSFLLDAAVIFLVALAFFAPTLMPGIGWGQEAAFQRGAALFPASGGGAGSDLQDAPLAARAVAGIFVRLLPIGSPAWRVTFSTALVACGALVLIYAALRQCLSRRLTASLAAAALGFSHAFYLHAQRPNLFMLALFALSVQLLFAFRAVLLGGRGPILAQCAAAGAAVFLLPASAASALPVALYVVLMIRLTPARAFALVVLLQVSALAVLDRVPQMSWLLAFTAFQFPFVGWIFIAWGGRLMWKRMRSLLFLLLLGWIGAAPAPHPEFLPDFIGEMLAAALFAVPLIAFGLEDLLDRLAARRDRLAVAPVLVTIVAIVAVPLVTTVSSLFVLRDMAWDEGGMAGTRLPVRVSLWRDDVMYSFWPLKVDQGSDACLAAIERDLPSAAVLFADPDIRAAVEYARDVEGRFQDREFLTLPVAEQPARARELCAGGRRVFLAGNDPDFYALEPLALDGEFQEAGALYEWVPVLPAADTEPAAP